MRRRLILALTMLAWTASFGAAPRDWRAAIRPDDRVRLRNWRQTWEAAFVAARMRGAGDRIVAAGALLEPDAALASPAPPDGDYRCRIVKLGGAVYSDDPGLACRVADGRFQMLDGAQRPAGRLWPMDDARLVFLGALALGDEARPLDYGRDAERDMAGLMERIGPARWRLVLPRPRWEAMLEVIELIPR